MSNTTPTIAPPIILQSPGDDDQRDDTTNTTSTSTPTPLLSDRHNTPSSCSSSSIRSYNTSSTTTTTTTSSSSLLSPPTKPTQQKRVRFSESVSLSYFLPLDDHDLDQTLAFLTHTTPPTPPSSQTFLTRTRHLLHTLVPLFPGPEVDVDERHDASLDLPARRSAASASVWTIRQPLREAGAGGRATYLNRYADVGTARRRARRRKEVVVAPAPRGDWNELLGLGGKGGE